jgi:hypothetical protein
MLDLDVSVSLLHEAQQGLGLPFLPHFTYEDLDLYGGGYIAECHMPAFLQLPATSDTGAMIVVSNSSSVYTNHAPVQSVSFSKACSCTDVRACSCTVVSNAARNLQ